MRLVPWIRSRLSRKMVAAYFLILLLPTVFFCGLFFVSVGAHFDQENIDLTTDTLQRYCEDINNDIKTCENIYLMIQQHDNFLRFLNGQYRGNADQLVLFTVQMTTMFNYAQHYSPYVDRVCVYVMRDDLLEMGDYVLQNVNELEDWSPDRRSDAGYWRFDEDAGTLIYRRTLRQRNVNVPLGVLEVKCLPSILTDRLQSFSEALALDIGITFDNRFFRLVNGVLSSSEPPTEEEEHEVFTDISSLSAEVWMDLSNDHFGIPWVLYGSALMVFLSFGAFSVIYSLWTANLSRRIVGFRQYIAEAGETAPDPYYDSGGDEFSDLVQSFNAMVKNNTELVGRLKLGQLRQQALAYQVLQAQIDPHFLYNALESIRMLSEVHGDEEVADLIFSLSRLMRYTFSVREDRVSLQAELDLVEQYLKLQKMRLGDRLVYEIRCDGGLTRNIGIPQFTVQPLVENALKYGYSSAAQSLRLQIDVHDTGGYFGSQFKTTARASRKISETRSTSGCAPARRLTSFPSAQGSGWTASTRGCGICTRKRFRWS